MFRKALSVFVFLILIFTLVSVPSFADTSGMGFSFDATYQTEGELTDFPVTFEATVRLPADTTGRGGVIVGNYTDNTASKAYCFIDGQLKGTLTKITYPSDISFPGAMALGGDLRGGNEVTQLLVNPSLLDSKHIG